MNKQYIDHIVFWGKQCATMNKIETARITLLDEIIFYSDMVDILDDYDPRAAWELYWKMHNIIVTNFLKEEE